ncbi:HNH endonuclease [Moraxella cuniculi]|uniref:HNH nuclease domain-containing protein n=1 Tax=Moraxella cuniculi TaxID=34061 RepID=A0A3S4UM38_9GAMM|nr:HNH endonuclease [Moraxella cuniculi]VEG13940.1 Uncharacterised protein [Moraxella cuniculi]
MANKANALSLIVKQLQNIALSISDELVPFSLQTTPRPNIVFDLPNLGTRTGISINPDDVVSVDGVLTYQDELILLFIPDHGFYIDKVIAGEREGNKFHIATCRTLQDMKAKKRYDRYQVTNNQDGVFVVHGKIGNEYVQEEVGLKVCKNCLRHLNYQGYDSGKKSKSQIYHGFDIAEYFKEYGQRLSLKKQHKPKDVGQGGAGYAADWEEISQRLRQQANWCCQKCHANLTNHKNLLHVHHIDGVKQNNRLSNLKVLCILCHSQEPSHGHMRVRDDQIRVIKGCRP